ncbi:rod shape-determining protein MreC [Pelagibaculum spongiae]|uniref:rod shape-determining protein MreC n=1 Tax=Pelagibaculum spongiae TaxID=2080658 RepID=UPI0021065003|nr:rod shape-determining protein MreC [Pelagibaculum spongiae]
MSWQCAWRYLKILRYSVIKLIFTEGPALLLRLIALLMLAIGMMLLDSNFGYLDPVRARIGLLLTPLEQFVALPATVHEWSSDKFVTRYQLQSANERLREEALILRTQNQKIASLESENIRLRQLLKSSQRAGEKVLVAEILTISPDPLIHEVTINKGESEGVYLGQPIVDAYGVMGQVVRVTAYTARALLVTDSNHALPVQVNRNGVRAIAAGSDAGNLLLQYVPQTADIKKGDLLVSSGLGQRFPVGYPVAEVVEVSSSPESPYAKIVATPKADLNRSREVLLVWPGYRDSSGTADES